MTTRTIKTYAARRIITTATVIRYSLNGDVQTSSPMTAEKAAVKAEMMADMDGFEVIGLETVTSEKIVAINPEELAALQEMAGNCDIEIVPIF